MLFITHTESFEKYLHYMVGQAQAEACVTDKALQQYFKVTDVGTHCAFSMAARNVTFMCFPELQETAESPGAPAMDVLTFIQQPVERMQTYQALLKVRLTFSSQQGLKSFNMSNNVFYVFWSLLFLIVVI